MAKIAYADPPYPGCAHMYKGHKDYAGEVDHRELLEKLRYYDGWVLHTHTPGLLQITQWLPKDVRIGAWCKSFAAFKPNVPLAYAWEPVIFKPCRKQEVSGRLVMRDFIVEPITMLKGLPGVKPERVCHWAFELVGARPEDDLIDLFPGTGAVWEAWKTWKATFTDLAA